MTTEPSSVAGKICSGFHVTPKGNVPSGCGEFKPYGEFQKRISQADGYASLCKRCTHLVFSKEGDSLRYEETFKEHIRLHSDWLVHKEGYHNGNHYRDTIADETAGE